MILDRPEASRARRPGLPFVLAGTVFAVLGLLALLWAAEPLLTPLAGAIARSLAGLLDRPVPAWIGKLLLAAVLLSVAGLLLFLGGLRWLAGLIGARRGRRAGRLPALPGRTPDGFAGPPDPPGIGGPGRALLPPQTPSSLPEQRHRP